MKISTRERIYLKYTKDIRTHNIYSQTNYQNALENGNHNDISIHLKKLNQGFRTIIGIQNTSKPNGKEPQ